MSNQVAYAIGPTQQLLTRPSPRQGVATIAFSATDALLRNLRWVRTQFIRIHAASTSAENSNPIHIIQQK